MKKLIHAIILLSSFALLAQNKFIEVHVTDTIILKPISYRCDVYGSYSDTMAVAIDYGRYDPAADQKKEKTKFKDLKKELEKKKYKVNLFEEAGNNLGNTAYYSGNGLTIIVNNQTEVQKLRELLSTKEVEMYASPYKYADEQKSEDLLIKKLIDKAKLKATSMGNHSGLNVGRIIEIKENSTDNSASSNYYRDMYGVGSYDSYNSSMIKSIIVRFSAE